MPIDEKAPAPTADSNDQEQKNLWLTVAIVGLILAIAIASLWIATGQASGDEEATAASSTTAAPGPTQEEIDELNVAILQNELDRQAWNEAVWIQNTNFQLWMEAAADYEAEIAARQQAAAEAARAREAIQTRSEPTQQASPSPAQTPSSGRCGGDLPPCCVMMRESGGSLTAQNPTSTASGKWQFVNGTWGGYGGYAEAWQAPESVQDARARELWAGGAGASHWGGGC